MSVRKTCRRIRIDALKVGKIPVEVVGSWRSDVSRLAWVRRGILDGVVDDEGHRQYGYAVGRQYASNFADRFVIIVYVLKYVRGIDQIEGPVGERKIADVDAPVYVPHKEVGAGIRPALRAQDPLNGHLRCKVQNANVRAQNCGTE
jgi:hypothetical protein